MIKYKDQIKEKTNLKKNTEAFWISPYGEVLPIEKESRHIKEIAKNPEAFNYTEKELHEIFDSYGEKYGTEGKAREFIIKQLIQQGWLRLRKYNRPDRWTLNSAKLNNKIKDRIAFWAEQMIKIGASPNEDVWIDTSLNRKMYTLKQLSDDVLYSESEIPKNRYKSMLLESVFEMKILKK